MSVVVFAGAVRANQGDDFALPDIDSDPAQRLDMAVIHAKICDL